MKYLTYLNSGCRDICDNMLISAEKVGIKKSQFIIVAFDRAVYNYYINKGYFVDLFANESEEPYFNWTWDKNSKFRNLVKNKWHIIKKYYNTDKNLMWLDTDVVFIKNPESYLQELKLPTFQIDYPVKCACTGLMYFPEHSLSEKIINDLGMQTIEDDQLVCNKYLTEQLSQNDVDYFNLNYFPNGGYFYDAKGTNIETAIMLHCNYIVGLENKINRLKETGVWYL
jgi:hypothetical protein